MKSGKQQQQQLHCTYAWCIRAFHVLVSSWATESREKKKKKESERKRKTKGTVRFYKYVLHTSRTQKKKKECP